MNRLAVIASLAASLSLPCAVARAETVGPSVVPSATLVTTGAPQQRDSAASGNDAPFDRFGTKNTRALGFAFDMGAANASLASRPLGMGGHVGFDSFIAEGLSVGGEFGFHVATAEGGFYDIGGGPRVGYALRLGDKIAFWPMVTLDYMAGTVPGANGGSPSLENLRAGASFPLVLTMGGQVAFELGPMASTDLWRSEGGQDASRVNLLGMRTGIVGWF
jgi:hypothetical protein